MRWWKYDYILRPNFELYACLGWLAGILATLYLTKVCDYPAAVFQILILVCAVMAVWRGLGAVKRLKLSRRMVKTPIQFIGPWKLRWRFQKESVWLGRGFAWTSQEIQDAMDILKSAPPELLQRSRGQWIHGVGGAREGHVRAPLKLLEGHTLILGTTGSGKTRLFDLLITQAIMRGERVIILDPKGDPDLRLNAQRASERYRGPNSFVFFHPAFPGESVRIDPLRNWSRATGLSSRIASLIPSESSGDPWVAFGWKALDNIIEGLLHEEKRPNLSSIRRYIEVGPKSLLIRIFESYYERHYPNWRVKLEQAKSQLGLDSNKKTSEIDLYIAYYNQIASYEHHEEAIDGLISAYLHNWEHFQKMVASLIPILSMLTSGEMRPLLAPKKTDGDMRQVMDLVTVIDRNLVLYIGLDNLADATVGSAVGSILLADLTAVAAERYNHPSHKFPVNVFIDEAAEVLNKPAIQLLNKGRGAYFQVYVATQTIADLEVRTGSEAQALQALGNLNNLIILRTIDGKTQKYVSETIPKTSVKTLDQGYRSGATAEAPMDFSATYTESLKETEADLMPAALLGLLPDLHYFCRMADGTAWKGQLPILRFKDKKKKENKEGKKSEKRHTSDATRRNKGGKSLCFTAAKTG